MRKMLGNFFVFLSLLLMTSISYALPFNIATKAGTELPKTVAAGETVTAYYTVNNNTTSQRNNNFVKSLPPNVVQVTSGGVYNDTCGTTFNLTKKGLVGDSCTLQLTISAPVISNNNFFVCFPGGITCAGPTDPLNVK